MNLTEAEKNFGFRNFHQFESLSNLGKVRDIYKIVGLQDVSNLSQEEVFRRMFRAFESLKKELSGLQELNQMIRSEIDQKEVQYQVHTAREEDKQRHMLGSDDVPSGKPKIYKKSDHIVELNQRKSSLVRHTSGEPEPLRESNASYDLDIVSKAEETNAENFDQKLDSRRVSNPTRAISFRDEIKIEAHEKEPILPYSKSELMDVGVKFNQGELKANLQTRNEKLSDELEVSVAKRRELESEILNLKLKISGKAFKTTTPLNAGTLLSKKSSLIDP